MLFPVEKTSEQRTRELEEQERVIGDFHDSSSRSESPVTLVHRRDRRRGSISISRFGQLSESQTHGASPGGLTPIAAHSSFYQAQAANMSDASFASGVSDLTDERAHREDHTQITQMQKIAGKQGLSKAVHTILPRRLSRTKSASFLTPVAEANLVIGVSVQESTTEVSDAEPVQLGTTVTVSAPGSVRHARPSRNSLPALPGTKWLAKVKTLTENLRPTKTKQPPLPQSIPS